MNFDVFFLISYICGSFKAFISFILLSDAFPQFALKYLNFTTKQKKPSTAQTVRTYKLRTYQTEMAALGEKYFYPPDPHCKDSTQLIMRHN